MVAGLCGLVLGLTIAALPAHATVRSHALYTRGLVPFNNGQWQQAFRLFDEAVQADPRDALALYYRGLTRVRLNQVAEAIKDLEEALAVDPGLPHAALDLGIAYFDSGQYDAAKTWLERAYAQGNERLVCALFLGITLYRLGDNAAALTYLNEAQADPEVRASASYYAGVVLAQQGEHAAAGEAFSRVAQERPQTEIGYAAARYQAPADARRPPPASGARPQQPWTVYGRFGFEYDSNVVIGPSDSSLKGVSDESDGRVVLGAGGGYTLLDVAAGTLRTSYDFSQSIHFDLTEFDLQGHRLRVEAASHPDRFSYGIAADYAFYLLDYQSFYHEVLGTPWVGMAHGRGAATQLYYRIRGRDFTRSPYDPARDGMNNAVGVRHYLTLGDPQRVVSAGYQFDAEDSNAHGKLIADDFNYLGHQFDVGIASPIFGMRGQAGYLLRLEDYDDPNSQSGYVVRRHDNEHQFVVGLERDVSDALTLTFDFIGVINGSNISEFDYDRQIVSIGVRAQF